MIPQDNFGFIDRGKKARVVFAVTLALNLAVAMAKLLTGLASGSLSMVADGVHSLFDSFSNVIGIITLTISIKPADINHPYGHRKFEALAAMAISFFMFAGSFEVLSEAARRAFDSGPSRAHIDAVAYFVMGITLAINILVSRYENKMGKKLGNRLLVADSLHTRSDIYASLTVVASLMAMQLNFPMFDTIASLVIVALILRAGYSVITEHLGTLVDEAVIDAKEIEQIVMQVPGVKGCHKIRSRGLNDHVFIDLHVQVSRQLSIEQAHSISFAVEERLQTIVKGVVDVLVHIEDDAPPWTSPISSEVPKLSSSTFMDSTSGD